MASTQEDRRQSNLELFNSIPRQPLTQADDMLRKLKRLNALDLSISKAFTTGLESDDKTISFHQGIWPEVQLTSSRAYKDPITTPFASASASATSAAFASAATASAASGAGLVLLPARLGMPEPQPFHASSLGPYDELQNESFLQANHSPLSPRENKPIHQGLNPGHSTSDTHTRWVHVMSLPYTGTQTHPEKIRLGWQPTPWKSSSSLQTRPPSGRPEESLAINPQGLDHVGIEPHNFHLETLLLQFLLGEELQARLRLSV